MNIPEFCKATIDEARQAAKENINPFEVLNYPIIKKQDVEISIKDYITQQDWYTESLKQLTASNPSSSLSIQETYCRKIQNAIVELGLNALDASIVVDSIIKGLAPIQGADQNEYKFDSAELGNCKIT